MPPRAVPFVLLTLLTSALTQPMPRYESPDGRFELIGEKPSDHFMDLDTHWYVVDTQSGKSVASFNVPRQEPEEIQTVEVSEDGWVA